MSENKVGTSAAELVRIAEIKPGAPGGITEESLKKVRKIYERAPQPFGVKVSPRIIRAEVQAFRTLVEDNALLKGTQALKRAGDVLKEQLGHHAREKVGAQIEQESPEIAAQRQILEQELALEQQALATTDFPKLMTEQQTKYAKAESAGLAARVTAEGKPLPAAVTTSLFPTSAA